MSRDFRKVDLSPAGEDNFPRSLPLVLPRNCSFNFHNHKLEFPEDGTEDGGKNHAEASPEEGTVSGEAALEPTPMNFKLVPEAVQLLEQITKPVAVLSMSGPFRSGKSYFLSRMLGSEETFQLGHTMEACTRGIWMASSVLECDEFALVLLDTEGIDAPGQTNSGVTNLLVLTMLLSSMFVYNSQDVPKASDLRTMR